MRLRRLCGALVVVALAVLALPAGADERDKAASPDQVYADALGVLRARLEALVKKAALLERQGDYAGALAAYSEVEEVYEQVLADLRSLAKSLRASDTPAARLPKKDAWEKRPTAGPAAPSPSGSRRPLGIGLDDVPGSFRGRGGKNSGAWTAKARTAAVDHALRWLAAHQAPNGGWEAAGFDRWCDGKPNVGQKPDGAGKAHHDVGVTGLALCAYLGAGYTNRGNHPYKRVVSKGLRYLKNVQDPEGCFGARSHPQYIYNHATAALAMVEAYGMTQSPIFKGSAQRALEFHALSRNPYFAWRYGVKPGDNDTSVSTWMLMAIKSGDLINQDSLRRSQPAPLSVDPGAYDGMRAWLDKMTDPDYGRVGYISRGAGVARPEELVDRFPAEKSEAMTAAGILARVFMGEDPRKSSIIQKGAELIKRLPPVWNPADGSIDMAYWYFGSLAAFQVGGKTWRAWREAIDKQIVVHQRQDTDYCQFKGSWDPIGPWGIEGGRVYSTALLAMCCEVYFRYDRVFGVK